MLKYIKIFGIILILSFKYNTSYAQIASRIANEVIIQLKIGQSSIQLENEFGYINLTQVDVISDEFKIYLYQFNGNGISDDSCLTLIKLSMKVLNAQFNHVINENITPNDPGYVNQWGMPRIDAPDAWGMSFGGTTIQGDEIVVAVLDGGFDLTHNDLNYWKNTAEIPGNGIDDDNNNYPDDYDGWNSVTNSGVISSAYHGTHVAGIIGAIGNNNIGVTGVNWNVKIMPVQAYSGNNLTEANVFEAYYYVYQMRKKYNDTNGIEGAFVVVTNASFSLFLGIASENPIWCNVYDLLGSVGILSVNAPENLGKELGIDHIAPLSGTIFTDVPAQCLTDYLIVVTNTEPNDALNPDAPWSKVYIDMAAPGTNIYSTYPGNTYSNLTGTSMAAPHVSGAIALLYAAACDDFIANYKLNPASSALAMKQIICTSSDPVYNLFLKTKYGRLNVLKGILKMYDEYENDLYFTGNISGLLDNYAIHNITFEDFTNTTNSDISNSIAGNEINLIGEVNIHPTSVSDLFFDVDPNLFDCAIPTFPLSVDLIIPTSPYCGGGHIPITVNAAAFGGVIPYTYTWYTSTDLLNWNIHYYNTPNVGILSNEDFWVKVQVVDGVNTSIFSSIGYIKCIDVRMMAPNEVPTSTDQLNNSLEVNGTSIITINDIFQSEMLDVKNDINIYPNPASGLINVEFELKDSSLITVSILDLTGKLVIPVVQRKQFAAGKSKLILNTFNLKSGIYSVIYQNNYSTHVTKLVIL